MRKTVRRAARDISARSFSLVDARGRLRAWMTADTADGMPWLSFLDDNGLPRLTLSLDPDGTPHIALFSAHNRARAGLGESKDGRAGLALHDGEGRPCIWLDVSKHGMPQLLALRSGKTRVRALWRAPRTSSKRRP